MKTPSNSANTCLVYIVQASQPLKKRVHVGCCFCQICVAPHCFVQCRLDNGSFYSVHRGVMSASRSRTIKIVTFNC